MKLLTRRVKVSYPSAKGRSWNALSSKLMRGLRSSHCTQLDQTMCVFSRDRLLMEYTVYTHSISEPKYSYQCSHGTLKGIF